MFGSGSLAGFWRRLIGVVWRPELLVFIPGFVLAYVLFGGAGVALLASCALPATYLVAHRPNRGADTQVPRDGITGLLLRDSLISHLDVALAAEKDSGTSTACIMLALDGAEELAQRFGATTYEHILQRVAERLNSVFRVQDSIARLEDARFAVALGPVRRVDLESVLQIAARAQAAIDEPLAIDAATIYVSASVGFCQASRAPDRTGKSMLDAARMALEEAGRNGPGAIRAFSVEIQNAQVNRDLLRDEVEAALEGGQIVPYFQPQLCTDTGAVSGFEALARWLHPERGLVPPSEFLPILHSAGLSSRLAEVMLYNSFSALKAWDRAGLQVPAIAVNFSKDELRNPKLPEKLKWELDRFDLTPDRLVVEILESVVAETDNDVVVRNISALARLGCGIDLDDFGTGHASIANIRRFDVKRIKIDRSFVTRLDCEPDQRKMVSAILSMAERLDLDTLAEGVETIAEHSMLSQLGCGHVQGFVIARPMPFDETQAWMDRHRGKLQQVPRLGGGRV